MIVLKKRGARPSNPLLAAGFDAEAQMAFYLRRAFGDSTDVFLFHDLRLSRNGERAQIDHLVFHRFGFVVVESKSITGRIRVNQHGEFERRGFRWEGMQSPIDQARLLSELLRSLLNDHKAELRRTLAVGHGTRRVWRRAVQPHCGHLRSRHH